jgi:acyl carrier protein
LTSSGKIDRGSLPIIAEADTVGYVPPQNDIQRHIASIWERVLGRAHIGLKDNFFDLGGHSLLAVRIAFGIQRELDVTVKPAAVLSNPTVDALARHLAVYRS